MAKSEPKASMPEPENVGRIRVPIKIRAISATQIADGTFVLEVEAFPISEMAEEMLEIYFPTQRARVEELLNVEALIAAIVK